MDKLPSKTSKVQVTVNTTCGLSEKKGEKLHRMTGQLKQQNRRAETRISHIPHKPITGVIRHRSLQWFAKRTLQQIVK